MDEAQEGSKYHEYQPNVRIPWSNPLETKPLGPPILSREEAGGAGRGDASMRCTCGGPWSVLVDDKESAPVYHSQRCGVYAKAGSQPDPDSWTRRAEAEAQEANQVKFTMQVTGIERNNWAPGRANVELVEVDEKGQVKDGRTFRLSMSDAQAVCFQYKDCYTITIEEAL